MCAPAKTSGGADSTSAPPSEGWIDSHGSFDSFGYLINAFLIATAIALTWVTVRSLMTEGSRQPRSIGPSDDPLELIFAGIFLIVAVVYGADDNDLIAAGLLAPAVVLLSWRAMRDYRMTRRRRLRSP
jgi:hypothetical protein